MKVTPFPTRTITINRSPRTTGMQETMLKCHQVRPTVSTAQKRPNPCPTRALSLSSPPKIGKSTTSHLCPFIYFVEEDDGQFEAEEEEVDMARRVASESPINKTVPIPEGSAFWVFAQDNP